MVAACAWILGMVASPLHMLTVRHAVCADHGQVVELGADDTAPLDEPSWTAPVEEVHDHGCPLSGVGPGTKSALAFEVSARVKVVSTAPRPALELAPTLPLRFAPKTSPPALS